MFKPKFLKSGAVWNFIKEFLEDEGGSIVKEIKEDKNSEWRYLVEYPKNSGVSFEVFRPKGRSFTIIAAGIGIPENIRAALNSMGDARRGVIDSIGMALWFCDVLFVFYPSPDELEKVDIAVKIYDEDLSRSTLFHSFRRIEACRRFVIVNFQALVSGGGNAPAPAPATMFL